MKGSSEGDELLVFTADFGLPVEVLKFEKRTFFMKVSVIIPAYNAAATLGETLQSLQAQTFDQWEAIIVDDGSVDATATIAAGFAEKDPRIQLFSRRKAGISAARNDGIAQARHEWLLFLDADDLLLPEHLENLTGVLLSEPALDAVHCGFERIDPKGVSIGEWFGPDQDDLFVPFTRFCAFAIHTCLIRRSLVEQVKGFDTSLRTCGDWDLWQRIARTGARFGAIKEVLARYRTSPSSASADAYQLLEDGFCVIERGHTMDHRVPNAIPKYIKGITSEALPEAKFLFTCWVAGLELGKGKDARNFLARLKEACAPDIDCHEVASNIFWAVPLPTSQGPNAWVRLWSIIERPVNEFLYALEERTKANGLARSALIALETLVLHYSKCSEPLSLTTTCGVSVSISRPIIDFHTPNSVERLCCYIELQEKTIGSVTLPVFDGLVPGYVICDAIAADFTWNIWDQYLRIKIYQNLDFKRDADGVSAWRGPVRLAAGLPADNEDDIMECLLDEAGWTLFLQELWQRPDWPRDRFYNPEFIEESHSLLTAGNDWLEIEVAQELPSVRVFSRYLNVVILVGGVAIGAVPISVGKNLLSAQQLRVAITKTSGFELCLAAIREGLLGRPISESVSLRDHLSEAAIRQRDRKRNVSGPYFKEAGSSVCDGALAFSQFSNGRTLLLGRRAPGEMETGFSRRAMLPAKIVAELLESARLADEPVIQCFDFGEIPERVVYAPDLIFSRKKYPKLFAGTKGKSEPIRHREAMIYDRSHFEGIFSTEPDPWKCSSPYKQTKYEDTLAMFPRTPVERALELGCAEGHFTVQLASRVGELIAADISQIALDRATERCADCVNVNFVRLDFIKDKLPGRFDLIVCSEVLYYVDTKEVLVDVARKLAVALKLGGHLLLAHPNLVVDEPDKTGFDLDFPFGAKVIGDTFSSIFNLRLVKELRTPLYRVQLFRRHRRMVFFLRRKSPQFIQLDHHTPLRPEMAKQVCWRGGKPRKGVRINAVTTDRLPILMYHRVALTGSSATARFRITPKAFEEQLSYLNDAGYYSVSLEDWRSAMKDHTPLPGRAVLITFEDGYLDFMTDAWPLLKRYGFSALVFLAASEVGHWNSWDKRFNEHAPLMGWDHIRELQKNGAQFGAHSANHRNLVTASPVDVVHEAIRSRVIIEQELGIPIRSFAYPFGGEDSVVRHLISACGYIYGLTTHGGRAGLWDPLIGLPRIEILGSDSFKDFVEKIES